MIHINTHVVDILGSVTGRDQPVMKMDKAVDLVSCLDRELFYNEEYVFFDPFCKAGEILLATALVVMQCKSQKHLILMDTVSREMYASNRYFALAPDKRHYNLSIRTFYGNERSHDLSFTKNIRNGSYLSEIDGKLDKEKFNKELKAMLEYIKQKTGDKKIIAIGNPPYQEEDWGYGKSAKPIYNIFIESLIDSKKINQFCLVVPARWFSTGKGLDQFRHRMIKEKHIKKIKYFENSSHIFPTVNIRGGICFLYYDKNHTSTITLSNKSEKVTKDFSTWGVIVPHIKAHSIIDKVLKKSKLFVSSKVWSRKPFGLATNYFSNKKKELLKSSQTVDVVSIGKKVYKIPKKLIPVNQDKLNEYKVAFPKAFGGGQMDKILLKANHFFILKPGQISTETYSIAGSFKEKKEAYNFLSYLRTDFARFLLALRKPTQDASKKSFQWVPLMSTKKSWTDEELFKYFNITQKEQIYIKEQVEKWTA